MADKITTITQKLNKIQQELKAPKGQTNKFGNYKYRSCEDILEAVKPLLGDMTLIVTDEIVHFKSDSAPQRVVLLDSKGGKYTEIVGGDRFYVKATAILSFDKNVATCHAYAREPQNKKGMDEAQMTGATSSYARKYALNGLFAIDDTQDPDTQDNRPKAKAFKTHDTVEAVKKALPNQQTEEIEL